MTFPVRARIAWLLCGWLCLPVLAGCGSQFAKEEQAQDDLTAAMQQAQLGKLPTARVWVDRAIAAAPNDLQTYVASIGSEGDSVLLGIADAGSGEQGVFTSIGDDADVVMYMKQAVRKFPNAALPPLILEQAQGRLGELAGQKATAASLAALINRQIRTPGGPISAALIDTLAQAYWDAGDAADGAATYRRVIATYPHDPEVSEAYNGLAYAYAVADDKSHLHEALGYAQTALRMAQKQNEDDASIGAIEDTLGWVQYRLGDYRDALINVQKGVSANPRLAEGRYHLAMVYNALKDTNDARIELGYALRLNPGYAAAQRELAKLPQAVSGPKPTTSSV